MPWSIVLDAPELGAAEPRQRRRCVPPAWIPTPVDSVPRRPLLALLNGSVRGSTSAPLVGLLLLSCLVGVIPLAYADPPDPTWLEGMYDGYDSDEIIVFLTGAASLVDLNPPFTPTPRLVAASLAPPHAARFVSADMACSLPGRAPPLS